MGRYAQLVIGPAGSGKVTHWLLPLGSQSLAPISSTEGRQQTTGCTREFGCFWCFQNIKLEEPVQPACCLQSTYCDNVHQHCEVIGRPVHVVNLGRLGRLPSQEHALNLFE